MHPRIVLLAMVNIGFDLLCLAAAGIVLLGENPWLQQVGPARLWFVVSLGAFTLVPVMYAFEREGIARRIGANPEKVTASLPAWAGTERTVRA